MLFNPSPEELERVCRISEKMPGVIVDNSSERAFTADRVGKMDYVFLGYNSGIAFAQNVGMRRLLKQPDIRYILLFDQDSAWPQDYPQQMRDEMERIRRFEPHLAALGPMVVNKSTGEAYGSVVHTFPEGRDGFVQQREVIASGCMLTREALENVGLNDERLFIDFVDCEWCWRAQRNGYVCGLTRHIVLEHQVGQRQMHLGRHIIIVSAPFRYYYQYRNLLWLARRSYVPLRFKCFKGAKALLRFVYFPFVVRGGVKIWRQMLRGIFDGLKPCPPQKKET